MEQWPWVGYLKSRDNEEILRRIVLSLAGDLAEPAPYRVWQSDEFGGEANNPSVAGADADPNGDGISNLIAYFADLPGAAPNQVPIFGSLRVEDGTTPGGDDAFVFHLRRRTGGAEGVDYRIEVSETLDSDCWAPVDFSDPENSSSVLPLDPDGDGTAELLEVRIGLAGRRELFARLAVTLGVSSLGVDCQAYSPSGFSAAFRNWKRSESVERMRVESWLSIWG